MESNFNPTMYHASFLIQQLEKELHWSGGTRSFPSASTQSTYVLKQPKQVSVMHLIPLSSLSLPSMTREADGNWYIHILEQNLEGPFHVLALPD